MQVSRLNKVQSRLNSEEGLESMKVDNTSLPLVTVWSCNKVSTSCRDSSTRKLKNSPSGTQHGAHRPREKSTTSSFKGTVSSSPILTARSCWLQADC